MTTKLSEKDKRTLVKIWAMPEARNGWARCNTENPKAAFFDNTIAAGYLYTCDARCGFELTKDGWVNWTHAGRLAMTSS